MVGLWFSGLQLEETAGLWRCPLHLLRRGQNCSRCKLQCEDATVTTGKPASVPSALFPPVCLPHMHFFFFFGHQQLPKVLKSTLGRFHLHFRREPSLCFDCKDPHRNRPAFLSMWKRSQLWQIEDGGESHARRANTLTPTSRHRTVYMQALSH